MQSTLPPIEIDVYLDLICPWCLIGKKYLEQARAIFTSVPGNPPVHVNWRSVQLLPDVPPQGLAFDAFYRQRLGGVERMRARQAQVLAAARQAGTEVNYERIRRMPHTQLAHGLLAYARKQLPPEGTDALLDALLTSYFQQGADLGDEATLSTIGSRHGLDPAAWRAWMATHTPELEPATSVPFFVFNREISLSGAQRVDVMLEAMDEALAAMRISMEPDQGIRLRATSTH
ncbi:DsbA family oxidoreductase [Variovorax rhizosphaerae]|uniref:DsbA family oxidoreductase n=1 Tax=Variovorax rhizosphaerae TaxID=1836200 RepID=A0ABU8WYU5_9BURK